MVVKLSNFNIEVTRAFSKEDYEDLDSIEDNVSDDIVAYFSFNIVDPKLGTTLLVCNDYTLHQKKYGWRVYSQWDLIDNPKYDPSKPVISGKNTPDRRLFFTSFFPEAKSNPEVRLIRDKFYNDLAAEVLAKINYFKTRPKEKAETNVLISNNSKT